MPSRSTIRHDRCTLSVWPDAGTRGLVAMVLWRKMAALFAFSMFAGLSGAACTASVEAPAGATDPAEDEVCEASAPMSAAPIDHGRIGRERCIRECRERYEECRRFGGFDPHRMHE